MLGLCGLFVVFEERFVNRSGGERWEEQCVVIGLRGNFFLFLFQAPKENRDCGLRGIWGKGELQGTSVRCQN